MGQREGEKKSGSIGERKSRCGGAAMPKGSGRFPEASCGISPSAALLLLLCGVSVFSIPLCCPPPPPLLHQLTPRCYIPPPLLPPAARLPPAAYRSSSSACSL